MTAEQYVLVVDDHPMNLKLVQSVLDAARIRTRVARSAEEVAVQLDVARPALILMDVQLPGTDGLTLTRQLRADPRYAELPIVALTAYAAPSDEREAFAAGCDGFMSKPIDIRALRELVQRMLAKGER